ncbi:solute carrier family 49 member A3-like [Portunus trituberculatus]|uniref:solute carrier family 49 member A3-like n=1 Tax=Portunus trituberculatus TaxID=210409 RepID=UPI001E1CFEF0|nr:solute carrier family 49 member A3-like [Portunus trituberculatus]
MVREQSESQAVKVRDDENDQETTKFKVYKRRWAMAAMVLILNLSNSGMCINLSAVSYKAADYFQVTPGDITWFSQVFYITSLVFSPASTYIFNKYDMKAGVHLGCALNFVGASVRALATSGLIVNISTQFALSMFGQALVASGQVFILFILTKVTQNWFPDEERMMATTVLAFFSQLAISFASIVSPLVVTAKEDVPNLNYLYCGLALLGEGATVLCVTRSRPPTPPSRSAAHGKERRPPYLQQLKYIFTSVPFLLLLVVCGAASGFFVCIVTLSQQILCAVGYSDLFIGIVVSSFIFSGFVGSVLVAVAVNRLHAFTPITKLLYALTAVSATVMVEIYLIPNQHALLLLSSLVYGVFGGGVWPITLEMGVETTYPAEETISTTLIFTISQMSGVVMILLTTTLSTDLPRGLQYVETCTAGVTSQLEARGYSGILTAFMTFLSLTIIIFIIFFRTKYRRQEEEKTSSSSSSSPSSSSSSSSCSSL